jgi:hypothetical protein
LPRSTEHKKKRKIEETMTYDVGIAGSVLGQAQQEVLKFVKSYWWSIVS